MCKIFMRVTQSDIGTLNVASGMMGDSDAGFSGENPQSRSAEQSDGTPRGSLSSGGGSQSDSPFPSGERHSSRSSPVVTASLDRRPSGDTSTGFSSVGLSPRLLGRTVGSAENPQFESAQREDERPGTESPDLIDCSNGSNCQLGGLERQTGEAVSIQTGQTGDAVPTPTGRHQPESRTGSRRRSKGDGGRTSATGGLTNTLPDDGSRGAGNSRTTQTGDRRGNVSKKQSQQHGPSRRGNQSVGRRVEGDPKARKPNGRPGSDRPSGGSNRSSRNGNQPRGPRAPVAPRPDSRAAGDTNARASTESRPKSRNRSQNGSSQGRRAAGDSNARRPGSGAAGARESTGRPGSQGRRTAGDTNVPRPDRGVAGDSVTSRSSGTNSGSRNQSTPSGNEPPRPPSQRRWLNLTQEEVSDDDRKELFDFVTESLDGLQENFEWEEFEKVVQELIGKVATKCESHMDQQSTSRSVNPNQGWRWRQSRSSENPSQGRSGSQSNPESSAGTCRPSENSGHRGGNHGRNHGARARRRKAARGRYNGPEAQRLQRLFRRNRKSCVREILNGSKDRRCNIPVEDIQAYFRNESSEVDVDLDNPPAWLGDCLKESDSTPEWDSCPISAEEVKAQLQRLPSASAPGPDCLPYSVWKAIDQTGSLLARILEVCRRERKIPSAWKKSITILLYKKGDEGIPSNWRPISLQSAIYKIYAAVWAKRLASWATEAGAISPSQKGFVPGEGCLEHSFLARSLMEDARRNKRPLHLVWFDLRNAFGSVPHRLLWFSMRSIGVPEEVVSILMDIYQGSSFQVQTAGGQTEEIPQDRGVKQGCPLSPLVFNLAVEGLIRGIESSPAEGYSFSEDLQVKS